MAPRAVWTGQLRLSLVTIPVEIYAATTAGPRVSFRQIHEPSGKRVRHEKTAEGVGPVAADEIVKGYETEDGEYVLIDPEELKELQIETSRTLELVQFVGQDEIAPLYYDRPYYVVPKDDLSEDAYRVIRDALRSEKKAGLCQITLRGKEHLAAIRPCGDGLLLETLRYAEEVREADPMFSQIEDAAADEEMLELAQQLIEKKTKPFDAGAFHDSYHQAVLKLIEAKRKDGEAGRAPADEGGDTDGDNVVDLMGALKKSLKEDGGRRHPARRGPARRRNPGRENPRKAGRRRRRDGQPAEGLPRETRLPEDGGAGGIRGRGRRRRAVVLDPETRCLLAALRPAAGMGRGVAVLGDPEGARPGDRGETAGAAHRGPSAGLRRFRGHDSGGRIRWRHRHAVGSRDLASARATRTGCWRTAT